VFSTDYINRPDGTKLLWSGIMVPLGALSIPLTAVMGPVSIYNLFIISAPATAAACMYWALRPLVKSAAGRICGALLFGWSTYEMLHLGAGQLGLATVFTMPLLLRLICEAFIWQRWRWIWTGGAIGLTLVLQLLLNIEILATEAVFAFVSLVVLGLRFWRVALIRNRVVYAVKCAIVTSVIFVPVAGVIVHKMFEGLTSTGPPRLSDFWANNLQSFVVRDLGSHGWEGYLGVPLILLLVVASVRGLRNKVVQLCGLLTVVALVFSMGGHVRNGANVNGFPLPWLLFEHVPAVNSALPQRLSIYAILFAAVVVGIFIDDLVSSASRWWWRAAGGVLLVATALSVWPNTQAAVVSTPAFFTGDISRITAGSTALVLPFPDDLHTDPMRWQAESNIRFKMPGGYFLTPTPQGVLENSLPTRTSDMLTQVDGGQTPQVTSDVRTEVQSDIHNWGAKNIIVGPSPAAPAEVAFMTAILGGPPQSDEGVWVWWNVN